MPRPRTVAPFALPTKPPKDTVRSFRTPMPPSDIANTSNDNDNQKPPFIVLYNLEYGLSWLRELLVIGKDRHSAQFPMYLAEWHNNPALGGVQLQDDVDEICGQWFTQLNDHVSDGDESLDGEQDGASIISTCACASRPPLIRNPDAYVDDEDSWDYAMEDAVPDWCMFENCMQLVESPTLQDLEETIDTITWNSLPTALQYSIVIDLEADHDLAFYEATEIPVGLCKYLAPHKFDGELQALLWMVLQGSAVAAIANGLSALLTTHDLYGSVYGSATIGPRFLRFYMLSPDRVAVELPPQSGTVDNSVPPKDRPGVPFTELLANDPFARLPWSFVADRGVPLNTSVNDNPNGNNLDLDAFQTFVNFNVAAVLRLGADDFTNKPSAWALATVNSWDRLGDLEPEITVPPFDPGRLPCPLQETVQKEAFAMFQNVRLPAEVRNMIVDFVPHATIVNSQVDTTLPPSDFPTNDPNTSRLNANPLASSLGKMASFVPVTPNEMDELVKRQCYSDLERYGPNPWAKDGECFEPGLPSPVSE